MKKKESDILLSLTTAAIALPGITSQAADVQEEYTVLVNVNHYNEETLEASSMGSAPDSGARMDIDVNQIAIEGPINEAMDFSFSYCLTIC